MGVWLRALPYLSLAHPMQTLASDRFAPWGWATHFTTTDWNSSGEVLGDPNFGSHFTQSRKTLLDPMKAHRQNPSTTTKFLIGSLSLIGLVAIVGLIAVPDTVMCDGDTSCIVYKSGLLDGTIRKMAPAEALQFWKEVEQVTPAVRGAPASQQADGVEPVRSQPTLLGSETDARCPPLDLKILSLRVGTLSPSPLCLWMA